MEIQGKLAFLPTTYSVAVLNSMACTFTVDVCAYKFGSEWPHVCLHYHCHDSSTLLLHFQAFSLDCQAGDKRCRCCCCIKACYNGIPGFWQRVHDDSAESGIADGCPLFSCLLLFCVQINYMGNEVCSFSICCQAKAILSTYGCQVQNHAIHFCEYFLSLCCCAAHFDS